MSLTRILLFSLLTNVLPVAADTKLLIPIWPGVSNEDGSGFLTQNARYIVKRAGVDVDFQLLTVARILLEFKQSKSCVMGGNELLAYRLAGVKAIASAPMMPMKFHIYTMKDRPIVTSLEQLRNKRIGVIHGLENMLPGLDKLGELVPVVYAGQVFGMARLGRVDALIASGLESPQLTREMHYNPDTSVFSYFHRIICFNTKDNRAFLDAIDPVIWEMHDEGAFKKTVDAHLKVPAN